MSEQRLIDLEPSTPSKRIKRLMQVCSRTFGQVIGVPDYEAYVTHRQVQHPDEPLLSREAFYRNRQEARFGTGQGRCCC